MCEPNSMKLTVGLCCQRAFISLSFVPEFRSNITFYSECFSSSNLNQKRDSKRAGILFGTDRTTSPKCPMNRQFNLFCGMNTLTNTYANKTCRKHQIDIVKNRRRQWYAL